MKEESSSQWFLRALVVALVLGLLGIAPLICCDAADTPTASSTAPDANALPESGPNSVPSATPDERMCPHFEAGTALGMLDSPEITEASGLVASRRQPGVLWVHNDSGDSARIFALNANGSLLASHVLGVKALDWEDIALGPGPKPGIDYLYIGDIGDNLSKRESITVHRIPEPRATRGNRRVKAAELVSFELRYPNGAHDAETLLSDPRTGDLYIITKSFFDPRPSQLFRYSAEAQAAKTGLLERLGEVELGAGEAITAGDISADGGEILLRGYQSARLWHRAPGQSVSAALAGQACEVPLLGFPEEPKGETIAFDADGRNYLTLSEGPHQPLLEFKRLD